MQRVQGGAAEDPGVEVAGARPDAEVEVDEPARRDVEERHAAFEHPRVEDHAGVAPTLIRGEEVDDRMAARFLLSVAADAHIDGQLVAGPQLLGRLQLHVELSLVVRDSARVNAPVAERRLEGIGFPKVERRRGLDVEVSVADHRRPLPVAGRRGDLAKRERVSVPVAKLGLAPGAAHEVADPCAGLLYRSAALGIRADAGDANELRELVEPGALHGGGFYGHGCGGRDPMIASTVLAAVFRPRRSSETGPLRARGAF